MAAIHKQSARQKKRARVTRARSRFMMSSSGRLAVDDQIEAVPEPAGERKQVGGDERILVIGEAAAGPLDGGGRDIEPGRVVAAIDEFDDVIAVHLVGGIFGSIALGLFADSKVNEIIPDGLFLGGGGELLKDQVVAVVAVFAFAVVVTYVIAKAIDLTIGLRVDEETEDIGLDQALHAETAYNNL